VNPLPIANGRAASVVLMHHSVGLAVFMIIGTQAVSPTSFKGCLKYSDHAVLTGCLARALLLAIFGARTGTGAHNKLRPFHEIIGRRKGKHAGGQQFEAAASEYEDRDSLSIIDLHSKSSIIMGAA
jgi:hypothetical protein